MPNNPRPPAEGALWVLPGKLRAALCPHQQSHVPEPLRTRPRAAPPYTAPSGWVGAAQHDAAQVSADPRVRAAGAETGPDGVGDRETVQALGLCAPAHPAAQGGLCPPQTGGCAWAVGWPVGPWRREGVMGWRRPPCLAPLRGRGPGYLSRDLRAPGDPNLAACWKQRSSICISRPSALETKYFILGSGLEPQKADQQT